MGDVEGVFHEAWGKQTRDTAEDALQQLQPLRPHTHGGNAPLFDGGRPFPAALGAIPAEDWCRTWAAAGLSC